MVALIDCPAVVVKGGHHDPAGEVGVERIRRALVAVDESHESDAAVDATRMVAAEHGAAVLVVHVRREAGTALIGSQTHALVESAARKLRGAGGQVLSRIQCTSEAVGAALAAAADNWSADLIVLGARRVTDLGGLLLGSAARDLVWKTRRPVLLAERTGRWSPS